MKRFVFRACFEMGVVKNLFFEDLREAKRLKSFWIKLSWLEFYGWYGRLNLGLAWVVISPLIFSAGISLVYAEAFGSNFWQHFLYVYSGYVCWLFIADTLGPGAEVYSMSYSYYSEIKLPLVGFNIKGAMVRSYTLLLNTATFLIVALIFGSSVNPIILLVVLIYFFIVSTLASVVLSVSLAYLPDLKMIIQNVMRLLFFLTPIVWVPDEKLSGAKALLVYANPFFYVVEAYRQIISNEINWDYLNVCLLLLVVLLVLAVVVYSAFSRRMVFVCK